MSATYAFRAGIGGDIERMSPLGIPTPAHALTPAAEDARQSVRRFAHRRALERSAATIVTDHGHAPVEPYTVAEWRTTKSGKKKPTGERLPGPRPDAASRLLAKAQAAGWRAHAFETPGNVRTVVEGVRGREAFRAVWHRGRAESATWHEPRHRYALVEDTRPVGVSKLTRVALAGKRPAGVGTTRLAIVASPDGIPLSQAELTKRVTS